MLRSDWLGPQVAIYTTVVFHVVKYSSYICVADEFHSTVAVAAGYPVVPRR